VSRDLNTYIEEVLSGNGSLQNLHVWKILEDEGMSSDHFEDTLCRELLEVGDVDDLDLGVPENLQRTEVRIELGRHPRVEVSDE